MKNSITSIIIVLCLATIVKAQRSFEGESEELGSIRWYRDFDKAIALAKKEQKDVLILFQEVPGCSTCRNYGQNVLTDPLLVEAIEELFVPLAIFNNKGGQDRIVLNTYNEPSWNNPVVRIVNYNGDDVISRISGNYSKKALYHGMVNALKSYGKEVPGYLNLLGQEIAAEGRTKEKVFEMYCFWSGEKQLAKADGVLNTESGFMNHAEVVKIQYDPNVTDESNLEKYAANHRMRPVDKNNSFRVSKNDVHYYLRHTNFKYLPLSPLQQTKINSALGSGSSGEEYLSPQQKRWLREIATSEAKKIDLLTTEFDDAWATMQKGNSDF